MSDLILYQEDVEHLNTLLRQLIDKAQLVCALLTNKEGQLLTCEGATDGFDTTSVAALVTGSFAATVAIANLIGESEFTTMTHRGHNRHILISLVDSDRYLASIFNNSTTVDKVTAEALTTGKELSTFLASISGNAEGAFLPDLASPQDADMAPDTPAPAESDSFESLKQVIESSQEQWNALEIDKAQQAEQEQAKENPSEIPVFEKKPVVEEVIDQTPPPEVIEGFGRDRPIDTDQDAILPPSKTAYLRIKIEEAKAYQKKKPRGDIISFIVKKKKAIVR